ncbi:uncharacterized protein Triagg1_7645 [Trichoderma aggressivum f. europaeum]|uniref:Uncharacterized protein n=1 Tax=Trichoderma aggressivum f. europaeum TaxID=173218 RepID=A0AAE1LYJ6_9HYPO|nr:hypothetical protein Triagg1_7645 [Trichoderma aggressivum f. europaeum]
MADDTQADDLLILDEKSAPRAASRASTISEPQDTMDLDDPAATTPKPRRKKTDDAKKVTEHTEDQEEDSQEQLVVNLLEMVVGATPDDLATQQDEITSTLLRLKELQDKQPPKVSFNPSIANSRRERLEGTLIYLTSELSAIPASNWASYKKKLIRFCESETIINMEFPQRLLKVMDIVYLPEELEAIPREEFGRMQSVARVCATAAQAMGPDGENTDGLAEKWVSAKVQDLEFLKKMFGSMRNTFRASGFEHTRMPWETQD